jgi:hypothetical protein
MKSSYPVPASIIDAEAQFTAGCAATLSDLPKADFVARWSALTYLEPGLHPDGYEHDDSGWPENLKPYAAEAWRRRSIGELGDNEMYCSYAQWVGLYDRMNSHGEVEKELREWIARGEF